MLQGVGGTVERVDAARGLVTIAISGDVDVPAGTQINIFHQYLLGEKHVATVDVVHVSKETVTARSLDRGPLHKVSRGDRVQVR
jgi:ABC-type transporter Mla subunit MlaD